MRAELFNYKTLINDQNWIKDQKKLHGDNCCCCRSIIARYLKGCRVSQIARFIGPAWGPSGMDRTQVGPMLAPWTVLSGMLYLLVSSRSNQCSGSIVVILHTLYHTWVWNRGICRCVIVRPRSHMLIVRRKIVPILQQQNVLLFLGKIDSVAFWYLFIHFQISRNCMALNLKFKYLLLLFL